MAGKRRSGNKAAVSKDSILWELRLLYKRVDEMQGDAALAPVSDEVWGALVGLRDQVQEAVKRIEGAC